MMYERQGAFDIHGTLDQSPFLHVFSFQYK